MKGQKRVVRPISLVCSPTGDFMVVFDPSSDEQSKGGYFKKLDELLTDLKSLVARLFL